MPTGYTAGIIDGTTKTFKQYAEHCMRAFGACVHMRDEPFNAKYKPEKPSKYHSDKLSNLGKEKEELLLSTNEQLIKQEHERLKKDNEYHNKSILKTIETRKRLNAMLDKAKAFNAPTDDHTGIKDFMIQQLEDTIKWDGDYSYNTDKLKENADVWKNLDPEKLRSYKLYEINQEISYHMKEHTDEVKRSLERNKWVQDFLKAIK